LLIVSVLNSSIGNPNKPSNEKTMEAPLNQHEKIDHFKLHLSKEIHAKFELATIRSRSLSNLDRWNSNGVWCSVHDE